MNGQRAELSDDRHPALEQLQHSGLVAALLAMVEQLRRHLPEPDTSIDWEDGEVSAEREARR